MFLSFALFKFVYVPLQSEIFEMQIETKRLQAVEKSLKSFQRQHENLSEFMELTEDRLTVSKKLLPEKLETENFVSEVYKSAGENSVNLILLQVGEVVAEEKFQRQSVKIKIAGDYVSILNFMRSIYDGERFAKLENISMEKSDKNFIACEMEFFIFSA